VATRVLDNVKFYVDEFDLSTDMNQHTISANVDAVENTTFGSSSRTYLPGLMSVTHSHSGFFDSDGTGEPDDVLFGNQNLIVTVAPETGTAGEVAYITQSVKSDNTVLEGSVGDMAGFAFSGQGTGQHVRAAILVDAGTALTSSSTGSVLFAPGGIAANEMGYAALHVVSASAGDTLDVVIESDSTVGFGSAASQITFTQATGVTSQWATVAGAVTDTFWRADYTIAGDGGESFLFIVSFGITAASAPLLLASATPTPAAFSLAMTAPQVTTP